MKLRFLTAFAFFSLAAATLAFADERPETTHLAFVAEYIRELAAIQTIRDSAQRELKQDLKDESKIPTGIYSNTLFQMELQSEIETLKQMRLNSPYDDLIPSMIAFYEQKIEIFRQLTDILEAFQAGAGGSKPEVDYAALAAHMPELRAQLDYIDHTIFKDVTPMVFLTLVDLKPDSKNHTSHLIITKVERATLLKALSYGFGTNMDQKNQNYGVSSASVLRSLLKERRCSDEPWE